MKKMLFALTALALFLLGTANAWAQDSEMKTISFEEDRIEGELMAPNSTDIKIKQVDELTSLIKAREDFVDEMLKSVEEL